MARSTRSTTPHPAGPCAGQRPGAVRGAAPHPARGLLRAHRRGRHPGAVGLARAVLRLDHRCGGRRHPCSPDEGHGPAWRHARRRCRPGRAPAHGAQGAGRERDGRGPAAQRYLAHRAAAQRARAPAVPHPGPAHRVANDVRRAGANAPRNHAERRVRSTVPLRLGHGRAQGACHAADPRSGARAARRVLRRRGRGTPARATGPGRRGRDLQRAHPHRGAAGARWHGAGHLRHRQRHHLGCRGRGRMA